MMRFLKKHLFTILTCLVFLTGLSFLIYPTFSDWWNSFHQTRAVADYVEKVSGNTAEENKKLWDEAAAYNEKLFESGKGIHDLSDKEKEEYDKILDVTGTGIIGYIDIPKIKIQLPVYHGTSDTVLEIAVGHVPGSSFPVGGESTHAVLSGHRGLPSARLFTDIDQLQKGDTFVLQVLDQTLSYEVDQIKTVLPDQLEDLCITEGRDYCTLVTCTPYGINTHRLLVRGHRIANAQSSAAVSADALQIEPLIAAPIIAAVIILLLLIWLILSVHARRRCREAVPDRRTDRKTRN